MATFYDMKSKEVHELIELLKKRPVYIEEIPIILGKENTPRVRQGLRYILIAIGTEYPLYDPAKGYYKILTDEDIENYRKEYRRRKHGK